MTALEKNVKYLCVDPAGNLEIWTLSKPYAFYKGILIAKYPMGKWQVEHSAWYQEIIPGSSFMTFFYSDPDNLNREIIEEFKE